MPNFWQDFWNFFHHRKVKKVDVVISVRDKRHHDSAYAQFEVREKRQSWL